METDLRALSPVSLLVNLSIKNFFPSKPVTYYWLLYTSGIEPLLDNKNIIGNEGFMDKEEFSGGMSHLQN